MIQNANPRLRAVFGARTPVHHDLLSHSETIAAFASDGMPLIATSPAGGHLLKLARADEFEDYAGIFEFDHEDVYPPRCLCVGADE